MWRALATSYWRILPAHPTGASYHRILPVLCRGEAQAPRGGHAGCIPRCGFCADHAPWKAAADILPVLRHGRPPETSYLYCAMEGRRRHPTCTAPWKAAGDILPVLRHGRPTEARRGITKGSTRRRRSGACWEVARLEAIPPVHPTWGRGVARLEVGGAATTLPPAGARRRGVQRLLLRDWLGSTRSPLSPQAQPSVRTRSIERPD